MRKTIISDTSCFIILTNIGELDLLQKVYGQVIIIKAKLTGIIPSIKPFLEKINHTNFRLSAEIQLFALKEARE